MHSRVASGQTCKPTSARPGIPGLAAKSPSLRAGCVRLSSQTSIAESTKLIWPEDRPHPTYIDSQEQTGGRGRRIEGRNQWAVGNGQLAVAPSANSRLPPDEF